MLDLLKAFPAGAGLHPKVKFKNSTHKISTVHAEAECV